MRIAKFFLVFVATLAILPVGGCSSDSDTPVTPKLVNTPPLDSNAQPAGRGIGGVRQGGQSQVPVDKP
jgi:hypothetical protein